MSAIISKNQVISPVAAASVQAAITRIEWQVAGGSSLYLRITTNPTSSRSGGEATLPTVRVTGTKSIGDPPTPPTTTVFAGDFDGVVTYCS